MRVVQAAEKAVVIWFAAEEAPSRWEVPELVRAALRGAGLPPWPGLRAECFPGAGDALLIARSASRRPSLRRRRPAFRQESFA